MDLKNLLFEKYGSRHLERIARVYRIFFMLLRQLLFSTLIFLGENQPNFQPDIEESKNNYVGLNISIVPALPVFNSQTLTKADPEKLFFALLYPQP